MSSMPKEEIADVLPLFRTGDTATWFTRWAAANKLTFDYTTRGYLVRDEFCSSAEVQNMLLIDSEGTKGATPARCRALLEDWARTEEKAVRKALRKQLAYRPNPTIMAEWINALCCEGHEYSTVVMNHWLWTVKRRIAGLPVNDIICPVLFGKTQGGKTTEILRLLQPLNAFQTVMTLEQITDERQWPNLTKNFVIFIDEMSKGKATNIETLKMLITAQKVNYRALHSNSPYGMLINVSFIGSSNTHINQTIDDETSGARFWELRCHDILDWAALKNINPQDIWDSINHEGPSPLSGDIRKSVRDLQHAKIRKASTIERWLDESGTTPGTKKVTNTDLYKSYGQWCLEAGEKTDKRIKWMSSMKDAKFQAWKDGVKRGWLVSEG